MTMLRHLDAAVGWVLRAIPITAFVALFAIILVNIVARYFQIASLAWFEEVVEALFAAMVFIGAAALWRENDHFRVDWLEVLLGRRFGPWLRLLSVVLSLVFLVLMAVKGLDLAERSRAVTPILSIPTSYVYAVIPISAAIMLVYSVRDFVVALSLALTFPSTR